MAKTRAGVNGRRELMVDRNGRVTMGLGEGTRLSGWRRGKERCSQLR